MLLNDALRDALDDAHVDVEHLISESRRQGTRRQRRRRTLQVTAAAASVALLATVGYAGTRGGGTTAPDVGPASSPTAPSDDRRHLAGADAITARLVAMLHGTVTDVHHESWSDRPGLDISLRLDGAAVTAHVADATPDDPATVAAPGPKPIGCTEVPDPLPTVTTLKDLSDRLETDPAYAACFRWSQEKHHFECAQDPGCWSKYQWTNNNCRPDPQARQSCTRRPDGAWFQQGVWPTSAEENDESGDPLESRVHLYTDDDWAISISAYNSASGPAPGPAILDEPVLTPDELTEIAASDIWFE